MTSPGTTQPVVRLERTIPAPIHTVYRAWLDPQVLIKWLAPGDLAVTRAEVDERVGGHFRIWQASAAGDVGGFESEIVELVPDKRIVFRWGFVGPERADGPHFDSVLTVSLADALDGQTKLMLVHERLDTLHEALPDVAGNVGLGWGLALDKLSVELKQSEGVS
jgi:uncharacterized protein YndB with AHSA1/START domain